MIEIAYELEYTSLKSVEGVNGCFSGFVDEIKPKILKKGFWITSFLNSNFEISSPITLFIEFSSSDFSTIQSPFYKFKEKYMDHLH